MKTYEMEVVLLAQQMFEAYRDERAARGFDNCITWERCVDERASVYHGWLAAARMAIARLK